MRLQRVYEAIGLESPVDGGSTSLDVVVVELTIWLVGILVQPLGARAFDILQKSTRVSAGGAFGYLFQRRGHDPL